MSPPGRPARMRARRASPRSARTVGNSSSGAASRVSGRPPRAPAIPSFELMDATAKHRVRVSVGADAEVAAAGAALGEALSEVLQGDVRGHGSATLPADEALAHVTLEASGRPLVVSNVDLSDARVGGLGTDLVASFLDELA